MADFSFSFDSDNPFSEPEPTTASKPGPKEASVNTRSNGENGDAENGDAENAATESAFALNDFDFSLGESDDASEMPTLTPPDPDATPDTSNIEPLNFDFDSPAPAQAPVVETPLVEPETAPETEVAPSVTTEIAAPDIATPDATDFDFALNDVTATPLAPISKVADESLIAATPSDTDEIVVKPRAFPAARVAILGASGIGKNHARWFHRNGAHIIAFLGTSEDSTVNTHAALNQEFEFEGTAYTDLAQLLETEKPDIVCVATPPALHFGHVLQSLEAGAHVLCEKPLVYAPTRKFRENRDGAKELVKVAAKKNLVLGTQLQYGAATPILCKLAGIAPNEVGDFAMEIETMNPNSSREPRDLWIDLGPHPVSVAQMLAGAGAELAEETIRFESRSEDDKTEVLARFGINCADGRLLMVRAIVRALDPANVTRKPRRRFSFNGHSVVYSPLAGPRGQFQAQFIAPDGYSSVYADPVDYLVGNFLRACRGAAPLLISGDFGRENLEWMLKISTPADAL